MMHDACVCCISRSMCSGVLHGVGLDVGRGRGQTVFDVMLFNMKY